jgi:hypothetical protein
MASLVHRSSCYGSIKLEEIAKFFKCCGKKAPSLQKEIIEQSIRSDALSEQIRNDQIIHDLRMNHVLKAATESSKVTWPRKVKVLGATWCWGCYGFFYGVSRSTIDRRRKEVEQGKTCWERKEGSGENQACVKEPKIIDFISDLEQMQGEFHSDKQYVELPPNTKFNHWTTYNAKHEMAGGIHFCCEYSYFCKIWNLQFPKLVMPSTPRWVPVTVYSS